MIIGIIEYLTVVFTELIHLLCYKKMKEASLGINKKKIICLLITSLIILINNIYFSVIIKTIISFGLMCLLMHYWFEDNILHTVKYTLVIAIISIVIELGLLGFLGYTFANFRELNSSPVIKVCITIILACVLYFIFAIPIFISFLKKISKYKTEYFLSVVAILLNFFLIYYNINYENYNIAFNIGVAFTIFILFILTLSSLHKKTIYKVKAEHLDEKVEYYEQIAADYKELKHNLNDDFLAIRSVANKETKDIVDEKIKKYNKNYGWISSLDNVPKGLQGLIYMKLSDIKEHEICVEVENKVDERIIAKLPSKTYSELCDALGITTNNAIEATSNCSEKVIYINLEADKESLRLKIINTFSGSLDLDEIGNRNYSTKKVKSGIGLDYLKKLKTIKIKKEIMNNLFIISILVPIN